MRLIKSRCTSESLLDAIQYLLAGVEADKAEQPTNEIEDSFSPVFHTAAV